jgi:exodeoxyribonuclease V alpha subunit
MLAAALVSAAAGRGDVCLDLNAPLSGTETDPLPFDPVTELPAPSRFCELLAAHPAVAAPGQTAPLVLDDRARLYLFRYWRYEQDLAGAFADRAAATLAGVPRKRLRKALGRLFPEAAGTGLAGQSLAAVTAVLKPLCVISGGPGTGKTTAAARVAALLLDLFDPDRFRILLAAPTGKAAARLRESMAAAMDRLDCPEPVRQAVPKDAKTIHRMLGPVAGKAAFRHDRKNPLAADAVIVDEASMVDVALMAKLVDALPAHCRLILMGDRDQLASVEAGAVLGDLCGRGKMPGISRTWANTLTEVAGIAPSIPIAGPPDPPTAADAVVLLTRNFRFAAESGIGRFSRQVKRGDAVGALSAAARESREPVVWVDAGNTADLARFLEKSICDGYSGLFGAERPEKALELAAGFKILCAVNRGPTGVEALNELARSVLRSRGWIRQPADTWYPGRPVLITRNDYSLGLFNGDLGVVLPAPGTDDLRVFFPGDHGRVRAVSPFRIPEHRTAFAMTVHKSQGSEFNEILLVLPGADSPVLTRELVYTAVTRARRRVVVCGTEAILTSALSRRVRRTSGLLNALWGGPEKETRKDRE